MYVIIIYEKRERRATDSLLAKGQVDCIRLIRTNNPSRLIKLKRLAEKYNCKYSVVEVEGAAKVRATSYHPDKPINTFLN